MNDILICTVPYLETYLPPSAPATLKGHLASRGYTASTLDLNIMLGEFNFDLATYNKLCVFFSANFVDSVDLTLDEQRALEQVLDAWCEKITSVATHYLGLSVFSNNSRVAAKLLVSRLREQQYPNKIVLGGNGIDDAWARTVGADVWIIGEGELALEALLSGQEYPGINRPDKEYSANTQIDNLDQLGQADYSEYDLSKYVFYDKSTVQITGSRGCVRRCTFCNVHQSWPKFRWRSGSSIANEIIKIHKETGVVNFFFTDSLINGNMKSFIEMCQLLAEYKQQVPELTWGGQFIVRKIKSLPDNYFELLAASGAFNLTIGVETGSDSVRAHMKKGFSNSDLDYHMEQFSNLGITCGFLMIVGYPTETEQDFDDTVRLLQRYQPYAANGTILGITLGATLEVDTGTPLMEMYKDVLFTMDNSNGIVWKPLVNLELTIHERVRRRLVVELIAREYNWNVVSADRELQYLQSAYENYND